MKSSHLLSCFLLMCVAPFAAAQEPFPFQAQVDALVKPYLEHRQIRGLSIGIAHKGKSWTLHYGQQGVLLAPDDRTIYEIGSISKVFTSLLLAKAVVDGQVTLDQTIGSLLPSLKEKNPRIGDGVTLQHLSQHMSGLPRLPNNLRPSDQNNPYADYDRAALLEYLETVFPDHKPGERHGYSNLGAGLLGDLLSVKAKSSYGDLLRETILKPLSMELSGLSLEPGQNRSFATPYRSGLFPSFHWSFDALAGAGAIQSTAPDMLRFAKAWLHPPGGPLGEAMELAWAESLPAKGGNFAMGLGWMIARDGKTRWHNGMTGGFQSILYVNRELDMAVVLLSNTADSLGDALGEQVMRTLAGTKVEPTKFEPEMTFKPEELQRLVGRYQLNRKTIIEVTVKGNRMQVQLTNQLPYRVYPEDLKTWNYKVVKAKLTFNLDKPGPSGQVTLEQNHRWTKAARIK